MVSVCDVFYVSLCFSIFSKGVSIDSPANNDHFQRETAVSEDDQIIKKTGQEKRRLTRGIQRNPSDEPFMLWNNINKKARHANIESVQLTGRPNILKDAIIAKSKTQSELRLQKPKAKSHNGSKRNASKRRENYSSILKRFTEMYHNPIESKSDGQSIQDENHFFINLNSMEENKVLNIKILTDDFVPPQSYNRKNKGNYIRKNMPNTANSNKIISKSENRHSFIQKGHLERLQNQKESIKPIQNIYSSRLNKQDLNWNSNVNKNQKTLKIIQNKLDLNVQGKDFQNKNKTQLGTDEKLNTLEGYEDLKDQTNSNSMETMKLNGKNNKKPSKSNELKKKSKSSMPKNIKAKKKLPNNTTKFKINDKQAKPGKLSLKTKMQNNAYENEEATEGVAALVKTTKQKNSKSIKKPAGPMTAVKKAKPTKSQIIKAKKTFHKKIPKSTSKKELSKPSKKILKQNPSLKIKKDNVRKYGHTQTEMNLKEKNKKSFHSLIQPNWQMDKKTKNLQENHLDDNNLGVFQEEINEKKIKQLNEKNDKTLLQQNNKTKLNIKNTNKIQINMKEKDGIKPYEINKKMQKLVPVTTGCNMKWENRAHN